MDPALHAAPPAPVVTFKVTAELFIESKQGGWKDKGKTAGQWDASLRDWVYPIIGEKPIAEIDTAAVLEVLTRRVKTKAGDQRFWEATPETASRCRSRIENILDFAKAKKERTGDNPASWATLKFTVPKRHDVRAVERHNAMPYDDVQGYVTRLGGRSGLAGPALEFTFLTVARTTEVRLMTWAEVDLKTKVWTIPKERMKGKKAHRVPLTDQAVAILRARERGDADDYVFPGLKPGRPMSENTMLYFLQETEGDEVTVHGFRSSFSDWVREQTDFPKELAEAALARLTDLKDEPLIIFARSVNAPLYDQVVDRFRKEKVEPNFVYETAQAQIGLRIVGGGEA
jgi:integrase